MHRIKENIANVYLISIKDTNYIKYSYHPTIKRKITNLKNEPSNGTDMSTKIFNAQYSQESVHDLIFHQGNASQNHDKMSFLYSLTWL